MVGKDCAGGSTPLLVAQQGGNTRHPLMEDANAIVERSGDPVIMGLDDETSQSVIAGADNLGSATEGSNARIQAPREGMVFGTWEEIDIYYRQYGKQEGFGVIRPASKFMEKNKDQRKNITWKCECAGRPDIRRWRQEKGTFVREKLGEDLSEGEITSVLRVAKPRKSKKCDCSARMYAKSLPDGNWLVSKVVLEHKNHNPNPSRWKNIKQRKEVLPDLKREKFAKSDADLMTLHMQNYSPKVTDGLHHMTAGETDISSAIVGDRKLKLKDGDTNAILRYLMKMHHSSPDFFHIIRHDQNGCLKDLLWVDARSRAAYEEFGDVVCLDTICLLCEYDLPLMNFVGINHHGQRVLLGCALMSHDDAETFEWVFRTWLLCMGDRVPQVIITDQVPIIRKALGATMPETRHIWCLGHIVQKFPKYLGLLPRYQEVSKELKNAICNSSTAEEFEKHWTGVINEYQLQENEWLGCLFDGRHVWVPAYTKHLFLAGISSTMRLEKIHSFFDGFVGKHTKLCEFIDGYCFAMEKRVRTEENADEDSAHYVRGLATGFIVERVFQKIYTDAKFREVQMECQGLLYCGGRGEKTVSETEVEHIIEDRVWAEVPGRKETIPTDERRNYQVKFNTMTHEISCECKLFEHSGILCRHSIRVYDVHHVSVVPENYILKRWRKDIRRKHTRVKVAYHDPSSTREVKRYLKMQAAFEDVSSKAMDCDKTLDIVMQLISEMKLKVSECLGKHSFGSAVEFNDLMPNGTLSSVGNEGKSED